MGKLCDDIWLTSFPELHSNSLWYPLQLSNHKHMTWRMMLKLPHLKTLDLFHPLFLGCLFLFKESDWASDIIGYFNYKLWIFSGTQLSTGNAIWSWNRRTDTWHARNAGLHVSFPYLIDTSCSIFDFCRAQGTNSAAQNQRKILRASRRSTRRPTTRDMH